MSNKLRLTFALLISAPSLVFAADTLIFALDIIRHGDRSPLITLPMVNYQWPDGLGQLTAEGMQQEYELGMKFRERYVEQTHLLPEHYERGTMYARATGFDRTLMSAESLLMGLYPPGTGPSVTETALPALPNAFQPIPIFSAPIKYDEVILQDVNHEEREKLMEQYVYSTKEWQQKNDELKKKYPLWSRLTGAPINNLSELAYVGDALYIHQLHHAPMPEGLSAQDIDTILQVSNWAFMAQEKPQQVARVYNSKLMTNIANYLNEGSQQKSKLKYVLLSAHDTTITGALSFLGKPLEKAPPYASNLNFSLYDNGSNYYTVKVTYNGKLVSIPGCGGTECELQQFISLVNSVKNSQE